MFRHLNIRDWFTPSHTSEGENRTGNRSRKLHNFTRIFQCSKFVDCDLRPWIIDEFHGLWESLLFDSDVKAQVGLCVGYNLVCT
jgi:hypothetical protein